MKVGIALATDDAGKAREALEFALSQHKAGNDVELFLVYGGVMVYEHASKDREINKLLEKVYEKDILTACSACAMAHGIKGKVKCKTTQYWHLWGLKWKSDRFYFIDRNYKYIVYIEYFIK